MSKNRYKKRNKNSKKQGKKSENRWIFLIIICTLVISSSVSLLSEATLSKVDVPIAIVILLFIVLLGVLFDIIGTAVTAGNEVPFHSMASQKIGGASIAVKLMRNASKVSNFCNDVVGDICGIISGSIGVVILEKVKHQYPNLNHVFIAALISAIIASMTVGGKAMGKKFAIAKSNDIIFTVAKILHFLKRG
ncbi:MAG: hypothetical protein KID00_05135 [Clostridium argentinense]|uniref:Mg2+ and Co2+ transporter CorB n=1 Tax=Clostridium faecium TaxID=2762223 RepID=A0ABR8YVT0_9CLOT|nr:MULTISPECIES: hypothetical protein [Clostridium]MBD8048396.1 hypothetical protein [Clostridium faecium]MBS5823235.1 hypothetical protein [Clostridium argentinense]MDU1349029.1 hypothetical protein [Clostridium argentinense]